MPTYPVKTIFISDFTLQTSSDSLERCCMCFLPHSVILCHPRNLPQTIVNLLRCSPEAVLFTLHIFQELQKAPVGGQRDKQQSNILCATRNCCVVSHWSDALIFQSKRKKKLIWSTSTFTLSTHMVLKILPL